MKVFNATCGVEFEAGVVDLLLNILKKVLSLGTFKCKESCTSYGPTTAFKTEDIVVASKSVKIQIYYCSVVSYKREIFSTLPRGDVT